MKIKRNMKRNKTKTAIKLGNIATMLKNEAERAKFVFCYSWDAINKTDIITYWFNGMTLTKGELDILYPTDPKRRRLHGPNPDTTKYIYE